MAAKAASGLLQKKLTAIEPVEHASRRAGIPDFSYEQITA
jgi:hypothetical protein